MGFAGLRARRDFDARHQLVELEQGVSPPLPAPVLDGDGKRGGAGLEPERELLGRAMAARSSLSAPIACSWAMMRRCVLPPGPPASMASLDSRSRRLIWA